MTQDHLIGTQIPADPEEFGETDFDDFAISFFCRHARGRSVLDVGCVNHDPASYRSRFWLHKAIRSVAAECLGMDLYREGVDYLRERGYNVIADNAEHFALGRRFDVISAGELIEHLGNPGGFLAAAHAHLNPSGLLLLSTPNPWYWRFVVKAILSWDVRPNPEHVAWYCGATLRTLLGRFGFEIVELHRGSRYLRDRLMPLPTGLKHTSIYVAARPVAPSGAVAS